MLKGDLPDPNELTGNLSGECPRVYEKLRRPISGKLVIEVPNAYLDEAEDMIRSMHHRRYSEGAPVIAVDVAEIMRETGIVPAEFRGSKPIYAAALALLEEEEGVADIIDSMGNFFLDDPLERFNAACSALERDQNRPVLLLIKNFDAVSGPLVGTDAYDKVMKTLVLSTARIGPNFDLCMHVSDRDNFPLRGGVGMQLNDAEIVWNS